MHIKSKINYHSTFFLFLFAGYMPANATVYFYFDAENGTIGANLPNPLSAKLNVAEVEQREHISQVEALLKGLNIFSGKHLTINQTLTQRYIRRQDSQ